MALRAAMSELTLHLGMVQITGNLYTPEATESKKAVKFKNCCKECYDKDGSVELLRNRSYCEGHEGQVDSEGIIKGKADEQGNVSIVGTAEEVAEVKASTLETKRVDLAVHYADDVDEALFAGEGLAYVFLPAGDAEFHDVLLALMDDSGRITGDDGQDRVLVGGLRVRDTDHLVRLTKWDGHLVVKSMLRPEQLKEFPSSEGAQPSEKRLDMGRMLISLETTDFNPDDYKDENRDRLKAWVEARRSGVTVTPVEKGTKKSHAQDLDSMLEAAIAVAKAKAAA